MSFGSIGKPAAKGLKKVRHRYLAIQVQPPAFSRAQVWSALLETSFNLAKHWDLRLLEYDEGSGRGILRCNHTALEAVRSCARAVDGVDGRQLAIHVTRVSGTLKKLLKKAHLS